MRRTQFDLFAPEPDVSPAAEPSADGVTDDGETVYVAFAPEDGTGLAIVVPTEIDPAQILRDRPDVLAAFFSEFYGAQNDRHSMAWIARVGGVTPEDYARYWYDRYGRDEGYEPGRPAAAVAETLRAVTGADGSRTTSDGLSLAQILLDRPDVLRGYYEALNGADNDRKSHAFLDRVGGETAQDYANYWYEKYGRWEGYGTGKAGAVETIDVERLLSDRPDVFRAFYEEFYGPNNDRKSHAWVDRVGGDTVQDYAKYWYDHYGRAEGYTQIAKAPPPPPPSPTDQPATGEDPDEVATPSPDPPGWPEGIHNPADDPWNHPAIFPDWKPPFDGWEAPPNIWHPPPADPPLFG